MKLHEIFEEQPVLVAINITSDNVAGIVKRAYRGIPEYLWEYTTPRSEVASFNFKDPAPEVLKMMLDDINENMTSAFMKAAEAIAKKYNV